MNDNQTKNKKSAVVQEIQQQGYPPVVNGSKIVIRITIIISIVIIIVAMFMGGIFF